MKNLIIALSFSLAMLTQREAIAQIQNLPEGAQTHWAVSQPHEIVTWIVFDPASVKEILPPELRFIPVKEVATNGIHWALDHLAQYPSHSEWGISFLEIVKMGKFSIDERSPVWPENGAAALWCARIAPTDSLIDLGPGQPFLLMDFWLPDTEYITYMISKGHYAEFGDVALRQNPDGNWHGYLSTDRFKLIAECAPVGPITGGTGSWGMQAWFPSANSPVKNIVRMSFRGHRIQDCDSNSTWKLTGTHPLTKGFILGSSNYEFGYDLIGGAYLSDTALFRSAK